MSAISMSARAWGSSSMSKMLTWRRSCWRAGRATPAEPSGFSIFCATRSIGIPSQFPGTCGVLSVTVARVPSKRAQQRCVFGQNALSLALGFTPWKRAAQARHGTRLAFRPASHAHRGAEVHQRLVEIENVLARDERFRHRPQVFLHRVSLRIAASHEHPKPYARDVGVENRRTLAKGEAPDRPGRVRADALERQQRLVIRR